MENENNFFYVTIDNIYEEKPVDQSFETTIDMETALEILKRNRKTLVINKYNLLTSCRFKSNALGSTNWYDASPEDRTSLIGALMETMATSQPSLYKTYSKQDPKEDELGTMQEHDVSDYQQVLQDGANTLRSYIVKKDTLIKGIKQAKTIQEILSYVWEDDNEDE